MGTFLETARLRLRAFTAEDEDNLVALDSDPEVMRFLTARPTPREEIRDDVLPAFLRERECLGGPAFWAAESAGGFVGWFELNPTDPGSADELELGYRLHRHAWGRGLATEGSRALIDEAFRRFGARRVMAHTMAVNARSRRVMEKAGLHFIRLYDGKWPNPIPGDEHGEVEYAITRAEWETAR